MDSVILVGGGGHAKQIIEIISAQRAYRIAGITDNDPAKRKMLVAGVPIIGNDKILNTCFRKGIKRAFISLGSLNEAGARISLYNMLKEIGFVLINVVHSSVIVSPSAIMGTGNALLAGSIINPHTIIGNNCILNTGTIVEHDCIIENHVHLAPGARLAGGVTVQEGTHIGMGALVKQGVTIGRQVIVGAGALVLEDIPDRVVCAGMPAKVIKQVANTTIN